MAETESGTTADLSSILAAVQGADEPNAAVLQPEMPAHGVNYHTLGAEQQQVVQPPQHIDASAMAVEVYQPPSSSGGGGLDHLGTIAEMQHSDAAAMGAEGKKKRRPPTIANDAADLTADEAIQKANEEGLTLIANNTATGFLYVYLWNSGGSTKTAKSPGLEGSAAVISPPPPGHVLHKPTGQKPPRVYQLQPKKGTSMGYYRSAEGAALAYARSLGPEEARKKAEKVRAQPRAQAKTSELLAELSGLTDEDAFRIAAAEKLTLVRSARSNSGYKHVAMMKGLKSRPYRLNKQANVTEAEGNFASAACAALAHARQIGPDKSAEEALAEQSKNEALELAPGSGLGQRVKLIPQQASLLRAPKAPDGSQIVPVVAQLHESEVYEDDGSGAGPSGVISVPATAEEQSGLTYESNEDGTYKVAIGNYQMLTREAALERAQTEGLTEKLESLRSSTNKSGFKNVTHHCDTEKHKTSKKSRPYQLTRHIEKRRRAASLGYFASAEAAALVQAHILRLEENAHANSSVQQYNQLQQAIAPQPQAQPLQPALPALPPPPTTAAEI